MEKGTFWAVVAFMVMGIVLSFTSMGIFLTKYDQDKEALIKKKSTLTDANALSWGATPGYKNISLINTFTFYTHKSGVLFESCSESLNYSYVSELSNRTYVPSSAGHIKYLPTFTFKKIMDPNGDVENLNIAAIKYFYESLNQPAFTKLPRYLTMIFRGLTDDFMNYYFTHTIYEFYTYDETIVQNTIFTPANIDSETKNKLWNDELYGWKDEISFSKWIKALFNEGDYNLQLYFQLTDQQMNSLIGKGSTLNKLRKLIINSVSTGVAGQDGTCLNKNVCTLWELAQVQWSFGGLTSKDYVPPVKFGGGSYATFNDSIPDLNEFYLIGYTLQLDEIKLIVSETFEKIPNILGFNTMQYIWENRDDLKRVANKLRWTDSTRQEREMEKAKFLIQYLKKKYEYIDTIYDTYAYQMWRFMSKMITEAGYMLRDGLHAKALFYEFSSQKCDMLLIPFTDACGSKYDFTLSPKNALIWVNAALSNKDSYSFKQIKKDLNADEQILSDYLYNGLSKFGKKFNYFKELIAKYYHCQYSFCQAEEMWYKQWGNSSVTQNYPIELGFWEKDKVKTIADWDIFNDRSFVHYEFYSFCEHQISDQIQQKLFHFNMGGIFGYYSLRNIMEHHFNPEVELHKNFPLQGEEYSLIVEYLMHCLTNYWYGGHFIKTKQSQYLFDYDNQYTDSISTFEAVFEGKSFRDNGAFLIEPNNQEFYKFATMYDYYRMDTGIKQIENVGTVVMTLDESKIKQKKIIYYNASSEYLTSEYRYPHGDKTKVTGSYGYAFQPNLKQNFNSKLQVFDYEINNNQELYYSKMDTYKDYDVIVYKVSNSLISLEPSQKMPIYISVGKTTIENCASIDGKTCQEFLNEQEDSEYIIEEVTGTVVQMAKTYIYWLKLDKFSPLRQFPLNYDMYVPLVKRKMVYQYTEDQMNEYFSEVKDLKKKHQTSFFVTLLFGLMFSLGFIGVIVYFRKNEQNIKARAPSVYSVVAED